ncbi:hypothetical protein E2C01_008270 [Portunus trituberculatus]|uniref:Uncharacterized protein n=1 Tax=Portunus trituberculatus TaxID=210409 RepID=A0A5B7D1W8_PORTR|nr:hypothetical protein [Portunus trituberculatus]
MVNSCSTGLSPPQPRSLPAFQPHPAKLASISALHPKQSSSPHPALLLGAPPCSCLSGCHNGGLVRGSSGRHKLICVPPSDVFYFS